MLKFIIQENNIHNKYVRGRVDASSIECATESMDQALSNPEKKYRRLREHLMKLSHGVFLVNSLFEDLFIYTFRCTIHVGNPTKTSVIVL